MLTASALLFAILSPDVPLPPYRDTRTFDGDGREVIVRSSTYPDFSGGSVVIEQRMKSLGGGRYEIDPKTQSRATMLYHRAFCANKGLKPSQAIGVLSGDLAIGGFTCYSDKPVEDASRPSTPPDPLSREDVPEDPSGRATDYVIARVSDGHTYPGRTFFAAGALGMISSVSGQATYSISVDNRRCDWRSSEYFGQAFHLNINHGVSCIAQQPGRLQSSTEGCVPRTCGSHRGVWTVGEHIGALQALGRSGP